MSISLILFGCTPLCVFFYFHVWPMIRWRVLEFFGLGKEVMLYGKDGIEYRSFEFASAKGVVYVYPAERVGIVTLLKNGETGGSVFFAGDYGFIMRFLPHETLHVQRWEYVRP